MPWRACERTEFYAPGSLLAVEIDRDHPIGARMTAPVPAVWFERESRLRRDSTRAGSAWWPGTRPPGIRCSRGGSSGASQLNGKAALVDVTVGRGHAVLYGFRPQYRGQSMATQPLVWGALLKPSP